MSQTRGAKFAPTFYSRRNSLRKHKYVDYVFAASGYTKDQNNDDGYIPEGETDDVNAGEVDEDGDSKSLCVTDEETKSHSGSLSKVNDADPQHLNVHRDTRRTKT
ncbi:Serine/threonine-protein kinase RIO2 [Phytophthora palmivora]|uniref:Serine/threonine-protein kinase RIO2 n=1 Tax=Phytophthora palmivora TaxID=4796 RepID=A0A2P4X3C8_9STRA|nr:Serine/threonine-protein kinase RIO2 [Phytophthora palmivora]